MGKPYDHAVKSAEKFGGNPEDYMAIHKLMDSSRSHCSDMRHRVLTHTPFFVMGILPLVFGDTITNSSGEKVSVTDIGEQHIKDDYQGCMPNVYDWIEAIEIKPWMANGEVPPPSHPAPPQKVKKSRPTFPDPNEMLMDGQMLRGEGY